MKSASRSKAGLAMVTSCSVILGLIAILPGCNSSQSTPNGTSMQDSAMSDGMMQDGMMKDGMMKDGMQSDGMMKDGMMKEAAPDMKSDNKM